MLIPLNNHIQVEPIKVDSFIAVTKDQFEEIGIVLSVAEGITAVQPGDKVYFDSFRCAKYPNGDDFYWLVEFENVRAYEKIPALGM